MPIRADTAQQGQLVRYLINGVVATIVHFSVLNFNLGVIGMASAGMANGTAAVFGIAVSFIGSRYFVFRKSSGRLLHQGVLFLLVYACIAVIHALIMYVWTDRLKFDYRIGFLLATGMQVVFSFFANKFMVFK